MKNEQEIQKNLNQWAIEIIKKLKDGTQVQVIEKDPDEGFEPKVYTVQSVELNTMLVVMHEWIAAGFRTRSEPLKWFKPYVAQEPAPPPVEAKAEPEAPKPQPARRQWKAPVPATAKEDGDAES